MLLLSSLVFLGSCKNDSTSIQEDAVVVKADTKASKTKIIKASTENAKTGDMNWNSMNDVENLISKDKKMILVDVYTSWCGPCKMMDARTFTDAGVQKIIADKFHPVKFNAEGPEEISFKDKTWGNPNHNPNKRGRNSKHQLSNFFKVPGYPTLVVMDDNFNIIKKIVGFKDAATLSEILTSI